MKIFPTLDPKRFVIVGGILAILIGVGFLIYANRPAVTEPPQGALLFWGTMPEDEMRPIIEAYRNFRPKVSVDYAQYSLSAYEGALVNALAEGRGPDVFIIDNNWLPKHGAKLAPANFITIANFRELYPQVVEQNFADAQGNLYALPLFLDTLALIYNKDFFDQAGIVRAPVTWDEFLAVIPSLRILDEGGGLKRAASAIGGSAKTIAAAPDILSLLMMQAGTLMVADDLRAARFSARDGEETGLRALEFYTSFANKASTGYTWDDSQPSSIESFAAGKTAMLVDYASALPVIRAKAPFLNIRIAPVPQATGRTVDINYANYPGLAVSRQTALYQTAWDFVWFATANETTAKAYLAATGRPPALLSLITANGNDAVLGTFGRQALTARSWYEADPEAIDAIFSQMIRNVTTGFRTPTQALSDGEAAVTALMK